MRVWGLMPEYIPNPMILGIEALIPTRGLTPKTPAKRSYIELKGKKYTLEEIAERVKNNIQAVFH